MRRCVLCAVATLFAAISSFAAEPLAPERGIRFDLDWMPPDPAAGIIQRTSDFTRLGLRGPAESSYCWSLRYPVSIEQYPVLVMKYRASGAGPSDEPLLSAEVAASDAIFPIATAADLTRDGTVAEFRKDVGRLAGGAVVAGLRFVLPAGAQLEIVSLGFERAAATPPVRVQNRRRMQLEVRDESDRPVAGAIVRAGALERGNWTAEGKTNSRGRVSLAVISPAGLDGTQAAEVAVWHTGFEAVYLTEVDVRPSELMPIQMTRSTELMADGDPVMASADQDDGTDPEQYLDDSDPEPINDFGIGPDYARGAMGGGGFTGAGLVPWGDTMAGQSKLLSVSRYRVLSVPHFGVSTGTHGALSPRQYNIIPPRPRSHLTPPPPVKEPGMP